MNVFWRYPVLLSMPVLLSSCIPSRKDRPKADQATEIKAHPVDRRVLGKAYPYHPLKELDALKMDQSLVYRRAKAWELVAKLLKEVPIGQNHPEFKPAAGTSLPLWQTWYEASEFEWMFHDLYGSMDKSERMSLIDGKPHIVDRLVQSYDFCPKDLESIFSKHAEIDISTQFSTKRFKQRLHQFNTTEQVRGISGTGVTLFSPGLIFHYLTHYRSLFDCLRLAEQISADTVVHYGESRSYCFSQEFPKGDQSLYIGLHPRLPARCPLDDATDTTAQDIGGAVAIKTAWQLVEADSTIAAFDTSGKGMSQALSSGEWLPIDASDLPQVATSSLSPKEIYTIESVPRLATGKPERYMLTGLHIITKDIPDWLWITLWWSPNPDDDFGADRPKDGVFAGDGPWRHYKMCVVSSYEEMALNPLEGITSDSLKDSLAAIYKHTGQHTWCSNPFIEFGTGNTRTNCIGCHQHAGSGVIPSEVFYDNPDDPENKSLRAKFPHNGRARVRANFPADYLWSLSDAPDFMQQKLVKAIQAHAESDASEDTQEIEF